MMAVWKISTELCEPAMMVWWRCFHTDIDIYYTYDFNFSNSFFCLFHLLLNVCYLFCVLFFFCAFIILSIVWTESSFSLAYVFFCVSATFCVIFFVIENFRNFTVISVFMMNLLYDGLIYLLFSVTVIVFHLMNDVVIETIKHESLQNCIFRLLCWWCRWYFSSLFERSDTHQFNMLVSFSHFFWNNIFFLFVLRTCWICLLPCRRWWMPLLFKQNPMVNRWLLSKINTLWLFCCQLAILTVCVCADSFRVIRRYLFFSFWQPKIFNTK